MSHSVGITLIANQCISLLGKEINVHMLDSIVLDHNGKVTSFCIKDSREELGYVWVEREDKYIPQDINEYENQKK